MAENPRAWERTGDRLFNWQHRCDFDGGSRLGTARMFVELHGCPFCGGYPPEIGELRDEKNRLMAVTRGG